MNFNYSTVALQALPAEPDDTAKFREQYYRASSKPQQAAPANDRYVRRDPLLLERVWMQIGRFARVA